MSTLASERGFDRLADESTGRDALDALESDVAVARATKDAACIAVTAKRLAAGKAAMEARDVAFRALEAIEIKAFEASQVEQRAHAVMTAGTLDPKVAAANHAAHVAAFAAWSFHVSKLPRARAAVIDQTSALVALFHNAEATARKKANDTAASYVDSLFSKYGDGARAFDDGFASNAAHAVWWPLSESLAREAFTAKHAEATRLFEMDRGDKPPTVEDLEKCFTARRSGLESARRLAQAKIEQLQQIGGV